MHDQASHADLFCGEDSVAGSPSGSLRRVRARNTSGRAERIHQRPSTGPRYLSSHASVFSIITLRGTECPPG